MTNDLIEFTARSHLVILHLPIGLVLTALLAEILLGPYQRSTERKWRALAHNADVNDVKGWRRPGSIALGMLAFGTLAALAAAGTGWLYAEDYGPQVDTHRWLGIGATAACVITLVVACIARKAGSARMLNIYRLLLLVSAGSIAAAGHWGGNLVHGDGYVLEPLKNIMFPSEPDDPRAIEPSQDASDQQVAQAENEPEPPDPFETIIMPALTRSCVQCHGPDRSRGRLRLDSIEAIRAKRFVVVPGKPDDSELVIRVQLPPTDPDTMPPQDSTQRLTSEEIEALRDWIASLEN